MPLTGTRFPTPQLLPVSAKDAYEGARTDAAQRSEAENAQPRPCRSPGEAEPRWAAAPVSVVARIADTAALAATATDGTKLRLERT